MAFGIYLLVAGGLIGLAAGTAVVIGAHHTFKHGSPAGAIALLLGLIVFAGLCAPFAMGYSVAGILGPVIP